MVGEARADLRQLLDQRRRRLGPPLHVATVARMQYPAGDFGADLPAVALHLRPLAQHLGRDGEFLVHDRRRAPLACNLARRPPASPPPQPASAGSREKSSVNLIDSREPYL